MTHIGCLIVFWGSSLQEMKHFYHRYQSVYVRMYPSGGAWSVGIKNESETLPIDGGRGVAAENAPCVFWRGRRVSRSYEPVVDTSIDRLSVFFFLYFFIRSRRPGACRGTALKTSVWKIPG